MPNHVTHRITITGSKEAVDRFAKTFITTEKNVKEEWETFDFNNLIPMPEILADSQSSSNVGLGLAYIGSDAPDGFGLYSQKSTLESYLDYPWVMAAGIKTVDEMKAYIEKERPEAIELGKLADKAWRETGHTSWYTWCTENWGTKWNAYSFSHERLDDGTLEMKFDTAWSVPLPVLMALSEREEIQDLVIKIVAFDEGWNFAYVGGIDHGDFRGESVKATDQLYEEVYGEPNPDPEEEYEGDPAPALLEGTIEVIDD